MVEQGLFRKINGSTRLPRAAEKELQKREEKRKIESEQAATEELKKSESDKTQSKAPYKR